MDDVSSFDQIDNDKEELKLKLLANLENKLRYIHVFSCTFEKYYIPYNLDVFQLWSCLKNT